MMRDASASIIAGLAAGQIALSRAVRIVLRDGTPIGFIDHDRDLEITLDEIGSAASLLYRADLGVISGNIDLVCGLDSSNCEIMMPISETITREDVLGRRFNQAKVWIFDVEWTAAPLAPMPYMKGWIADGRIEGNAAVFEVRSLQDYYNQAIGRILSPRCSADFGDTQCGVAKVKTAATVTQVLDSMEFTISLAGTLADGYYRYGEVEFTSGRLTDLWPLEVFDYTGSDGTVSLLAPAPGRVQVGDTLMISQGCSNVKSSTDPAVPTCLSHDNVNRFRGFDRVPGSDVYFRAPIPGEA